MVNIGKTLILLTVGLAIGGLLVGNLFPLAINSMEEPGSQTIEHTEGVSEKLKVTLYANATDINATSDEVTLELYDNETGSSQSQVVANGSTASYSIDDGTGTQTVNATVETITDSTTATVSYEYPSDYGYSEGTKAMWTILPLFFILVILGALAGFIYMYM